MSVCNVADEKCPKVAGNFSNINKKITTVLSNVNKNCLQVIFYVCYYVAVSQCFCYGDGKLTFYISASMA